MKTLYSLVVVTFMLFSCQNQQQSDVALAKKATIDSMKTAHEKQRVIDSMQMEIAKTENKVQQDRTTTKVITQTAPAAEPQRKGWSNAAKGAVIGAGVGAATGALTSKKKGEGAVIGGVVGAGVGAGTGAIIDDSKK
ncbi:YMGG-like glycine zipper-containing protein [Flavobacterium agrisoli]|uniref:Glycine zipper family protein n=1 Tax=Flavobacterium agrisoli TaxID=2793066 RepID=A0A934PJF1_9FLAO|nr:YMGG-like glycine zipper-containing protein [Flavobacterium agrisoli]MBK0369237.1 glycine zipper family protein [Flavobacterium agrisoli]